ncbi:MAG: endonuclease/exonuclease/phosphatase family protein [bacterium]|nr:endonuclease/exonuclease/phosphatase family protein [bacterium]
MSALGLLGCGVAFLALSLSRAEVEEATGRRVATVRTWNIGAGRASADRVVAELHATEADVVALQEVTQEVRRSIEARPPVQFPHRVYHARGISGKALLSRHPILEWQGFWTHGERNYLRAVVDHGELTVTYYVVHVSPMAGLFGRYSRAAAHAEELAHAAAEDDNSVLLGDFNMTPLSAVYGRMLAAGIRAAQPTRRFRPESTFPVFLRYRGLPVPPILRLDHVLTGGSLTAVDNHVLPDGGSDHLPVEARLVMRRK